MESFHRVGLVACNATLGFGLPPEDGTPFVQELWDAEIVTGSERYNDGVLCMLSMVHVSGKFRLWY